MMKVISCLLAVAFVFVSAGRALADEPETVGKGCGLRFAEFGAKKNSIERLMVAAGPQKDSRELRNSLEELPHEYIADAGDQSQAQAELLAAISNSASSGELPELGRRSDREIVIGVLSGRDLSAEEKQAGNSLAHKIRSENPQLADRIEQSIKLTPTEIIAERNKAKTVSFLWYPNNPLIPIATHTKLMVDGELWSTISAYHSMGRLRTHEALARQKRSSRFFQFDIRATPQEIERIKYLLINNNRRGTGLGTCVRSACGALAEAGVLNVPPVLNQIPSLAALYITAIRLANPSKVPRIRFVGKNVGRGFISFSILMDGVWIGSATVVGATLTSKAIHVLDAISEPTPQPSK